MAFAMVFDPKAYEATEIAELKKEPGESGEKL